MKALSLLVSICFSIQLFSQITVTSADMPGVGDTVKISAAVDFGTADPDLTGTGYHWDFRFLQYDAQDDDYYLSVPATNFFHMAAFNSIADFALTGPDQDIPQGVPLVTIRDRFDFFHLDSDAYTQVGYGAVINGAPLPTSIVYDSTDYIHRFPLDYGDKDTNYVRFNINIIGLGDYSTFGTRINEVIGHGWISTPFDDSIPCLHVKSVLDLKDTISVTTPFPFTQGIDHDITEYRWVANGHKVPILTVVDDNLIGFSVRYKDIERPLSGFSHDVADTVCILDNVVFTDESTGPITNWDWDFGNDASPSTATGAGPHTVTYTAPGFKTVSLEVSGPNGTNEETQFNTVEVKQCSVGINEYDEIESLKIFPNPADNFVRIQYAPEIRIREVTLLDIQGRTVADFGQPQSGQELSTEDLKGGHYIMRIVSEDKVVAHRLVIR